MYLVLFFSCSPSYVSKTLEERIDESNVGHQMLKKMGEWHLSIHELQFFAVLPFEG